MTNMPKQKTHKGTKKRFRLTANGKIKHRSAGTSHLAARMTQKRTRKLRGTTTLGSGMQKAIKIALAGNSY
jgi:large subunit ribosomal protein L35